MKLYMLESLPSTLPLSYEGDVNEEKRNNVSLDGIAEGDVNEEKKRNNVSLDGIAVGREEERE